MRSILLLPLIVACAEPDASTDAVDSDPEVREPEATVVLMSQVGFVGAEGTESDGFDLDDVVTAGGDPTGCGKPDATATDGTPGIDNAFGSLLPIIASLGGAALPSLVQNEVLSGELLLILELDGVLDAPVDTCVPGRLVRGFGAPALSTDGVILPGQTFDTDPEESTSELSCVVRRADGSVEADDVSFRLRLNVFDESIDLSMLDGKVRMWPTEAGWSGMIGGGISVAEITTNVLGFDAIPESLELGVVSAVEINADLLPDPNGVCTRLSATLSFDAVPAFLFEDAVR